MIIDLCAYGLVRLLGLLPMWLLYAIGGIIGRIMWWTNSDSAKISRINLAICYPQLSEKERNQIARASVLEMGTILIESIAVWCKPFEKAFEHRVLSFQGKSLLDEALQNNRPVVLIASHFGNYEVLYLLVHKLIGNISLLYRPIKLKRLGAFILKSRGKHGGHMMPTNREGITRFCEAVKHPDGVVAIAGDLVPSRERGDFVSFFGAPTLSPHFPTDLVRNSNAIALCIHMVRVKNNRFKVVLEEFPEDIYSEDKKLATQAMMQGIEKIVAANPEQYAWSYKRFKRMPNGEKLYNL